MIYLVCALSILFGFFIHSHPLDLIRFQQKVYFKLNWRMEPVSMDKEMRNTRLMGAGLISFSLVVLVMTAIGIL